MASRACTICRFRYPDSKRFYRCVPCLAPTKMDSRGPTVTPLQADKRFEAARTTRRNAFERQDPSGRIVGGFYYKQVEHRRSMGYPEPEEVGRMQAKKEIERMRELESLWEQEDEDAEVHHGRT